MKRSDATRELSQGRLRVQLLAILAVAYVAFAAAACRLPRQLPRICLFHRITGRPCPLCGLTRAVGLCTRGKFRDAASTYPVAMGAGIAGLVSLALINRSRLAE